MHWSVYLYEEAVQSRPYSMLSVTNKNHPLPSCMCVCKRETLSPRPLSCRWRWRADCCTPAPEWPGPEQGKQRAQWRPHVFGMCVSVCACTYLCVLRGDLQQQRQGVVVEGFVQGEQRSVHAALAQVAAVLLQPNSLDPADHALVAPHKHICGCVKKHTHTRFLLVFLNISK